MDETKILLATQGEKLGANLFAYCNNDPINRVDPTGEFSASKAKAYADKWWDGFNPLYKRNKYDCANFVSQCLYAGEFSSMTSSWYNLKIKISYAWGHADGLKNWLQKTTTTLIISTWVEIKLLGVLMLIFNCPYCSFVFIVDYAGDGEYDHAVISGYVDPVTADIYFYGHTNARNGKKYSITRSRGKNPSLESFLYGNPKAKIFVARTW